MSYKEKSLLVSCMGLSDIGLVRTNNEDSFLIADLTTGVDVTTPRLLEYHSGPKGNLFVVADGMGGAAAGEVASRMAVESVIRLLKERDYNNCAEFGAA